MVTRKYLGEIAKTFNERHGDLFEVWEINVVEPEAELNDREMWLLRIGSVNETHDGPDLVLMGDLGITVDAYSASRTSCLGRCPANPTVDQVVETMLRVSTEYWVADDIHES